MKCKFCGGTLPDKAVFCPGCGTKVSAAYSEGVPKRAVPPPKPATPQSAAPHTSAAPAKKNNAGCLSIITGTMVLMVVFIICFAVGSAGMNALSGSEPHSQSKYQTSVLYSDKEGLRLAVEIDDYSGSIMAAGTYSVYVDTGFLTGNQYPALYGIYVTEAYYEYVEELQEEDLIALAGGWNLDEATFTVEAGQYIYCKLESTAGTPVGTLVLTQEANQPTSASSEEFSPYENYSFYWGGLENYKGACEIDDYGDDVFPAGTYYAAALGKEFTLDEGEEYATWLIYVTKEDLQTVEQLKEEYLVGYVGGPDLHEASVTLEPGDYLYIILQPMDTFPYGGIELSLTEQSSQ